MGQTYTWYLWFCAPAIFMGDGSSRTPCITHHGVMRSRACFALDDISSITAFCLSVKSLSHFRFSLPLFPLCAVSIHAVWNLQWYILLHIVNGRNISNHCNTDLHHNGNQRGGNESGGSVEREQQWTRLMGPGESYDEWDYQVQSVEWFGGKCVATSTVLQTNGQAGGTPTNCHTGVCRSIGSILRGQFP